MSIARTSMPSGVDRAPRLVKRAARREDFASDKTKRFALVWLDEDEDPFLQMDINLDGGLPEANLADSLDIWRGQLSEFKDCIDW